MVFYFFNNQSNQDTNKNKLKTELNKDSEGVTDNQDFSKSYLIDKNDKVKEIDKIKVEILNGKIIEGRFPQKDYEYLDLEIKITNNQDKPLKINSVFNMEIVDEKGNIYSDNSIFTSSKGFDNIIIDPSNSVTSNVSFEVPKNAENLTLYFFPNFLEINNYLKFLLK